MSSSRRNYFVSLALLCLALGLGAAGYRLCTDLAHELAITRTQKEIALAAKKEKADTEPLVASLKERGLSFRQLDVRHQKILVALGTKQAETYAANIEEALYEKNYPLAYRDLARFRALFRALGNSEELFPRYRCLEDAYRDHEFMYGLTDPPPRYQCLSGAQSL